MSYCSTNTITNEVNINRLYDVLSFLGYKQSDSDVLSSIPGFQRYYYWDGDESFSSLVGIELSVYS